MPKSIRKTILVAVSVVILMFGFSFALSPLYNAFCKTTGFYSRVNVKSFSSPDLSRQITVQFVATNNQNLPWDFYPRTVSIPVHPEENTRVIFYAKNNTNKPMTVQAIPSFSPSLAAQYFHKTECFCFTHQTLKAGEEINMPVVFVIDKAIPDTMHTITLSYTLFDVTPTLSQRTNK